MKLSRRNGAQDHPIPYHCQYKASELICAHDKEETGGEGCRYLNETY
jgi:hypothetical protein